VRGKGVSLKQHETMMSYTKRQPEYKIGHSVYSLSIASKCQELITGFSHFLYTCSHNIKSIDVSVNIVNNIAYKECANLKNNSPILNAVKIVGVSLLTIGVIIFILGFFGSPISNMIPIGIGTVVGAVLIFVMGLFFVATEEMLVKTGRG
jgi:hypothetical protein